jgi:hypothetical protein
MDLHVPSSMRTVGITKFVQGGCQNNLQMSTYGHAWEHACIFCSNVMKEKLSCNELSPYFWAPQRHVMDVDL